ncbi:uncharacterized protein LOC144715927 [Wolffia australiana]
MVQPQPQPRKHLRRRHRRPRQHQPFVFSPLRKPRRRFHGKFIRCAREFCNYTLVFRRCRPKSLQQKNQAGCEREPDTTAGAWTGIAVFVGMEVELPAYSLGGRLRLHVPC